MPERLVRVPQSFWAKRVERMADNRVDARWLEAALVTGYRIVEAV